MQKITVLIIALALFNTIGCNEPRGNKAANDNATNQGEGMENLQEIVDSTQYTGAHLEDATDNTIANSPVSDTTARDTVPH